MKSYSPTEQSQPTVVKYVQQTREGIQAHSLMRHAIGCVLKGKKHIYHGDVRHEVKQGELFYLNMGHHYIDNLPDGDKPFEQIVFFYSPEELGKIIMKLSTQYQMKISDTAPYGQCVDQSHVISPAWNTVKNFFNSVNQYLKDDMFGNDGTAEQMKSVELVYLILARNDCPIRLSVMNSIDLSVENFENIIHEHLFDDISIEKLADMCNRSLTSFKKEFKRHFNESPHRWIIRQRMMYARMLLISTSKPVSEVGNDCSFPNTSHFIKLFKNEFAYTPSAYRNRSRKRVTDEMMSMQCGASMATV